MQKIRLGDLELEALFALEGATRADVVKQLVLFKLTEMGYFDEGKKEVK